MDSKLYGSINIKTNSEIFTNFKDLDSYGGDQDWYRNVNKQNRKNTGCGSVAAANVLLYYIQQDIPLISDKLSKSYFKDKNSITKKEFTNFMNDLYLKYLGQTIYTNFFNNELSFGIWSIHRFCKGLKKYATSCDVKLTEHYISNSNNSFNNAKLFIETAIYNNYPVVVLIKLNKYAKNLHTLLDKHFVTITGMNEFKNDFSITISNFGNKVVIKSFRALWESKNISTFFGGNVCLAYFNI